MAKFFGKIGYGVTEETRPGVWNEVFTEREYFGDVLKLNSRTQTTDQVNDDITIQNQISILADPFAYSHFHEMKYIEFMGTRWKVTNVEVKYPRLVLTTGGVYNG